MNLATALTWHMPDNIPVSMATFRLIETVAKAHHGRAERRPAGPGLLGAHLVKVSFTKPSLPDNAADRKAFVEALRPQLADTLGWTI